MLNSLKFVQGSVAKKDFVPALTHFKIENGRVSGFNGTLALSSPIPFDITCCPKAETLIKAVTNCTDTVQLVMTAAGRLSIKSGAFKASIECLIGEMPYAEPEGDIIQFDGEALLKGLKAVTPFMSEDASRMWSQGVLIKDQSLFATNNVILVQNWIGSVFPHVINIPKTAVKEMLRINQAPLYAQLAENSITFHYDNERWLRTQLYVTDWPNLSSILDQPSEQKPFDKMIFKGLEIIKPFLNKTNSIFISNGQIATSIIEGEGAVYDMPSLQHDGIFNHTMLSMLEGAVETIDWTTYPKPCLFQGGMLRGAIIGTKA